MHKDLYTLNNPTIKVGNDDHSVEIPLKSFLSIRDGESVRQACPNLNKCDYEFLERGQLPGRQEEYFVEL
jgi:hypothetical protein